MDNKFTDNEIIKALKKCTHESGTCEGCIYADDGCLMEDGTNKLIRDALDLINRQKAEIERLKKPINCNNCVLVQLKSKEVKQTKVEAIKEFAERLKSKFAHSGKSTKYGEFTWDDVKSYELDNLVKEMTEQS